MIIVDDYKEIIKEMCKDYFLFFFDIVYNLFMEFGFDKMGKLYFKEYVSDFVG